MSDSEVAIFIDGGYLDKVLLYEFNRAPVSYLKVTQRAAGPRAIFRTYYYYCPMYVPPNPSPEIRDKQQAQDRFFAKLRSFNRFEVRLGRLQHAGTTKEGEPIFKQKQVDILLGLDFALVVERKKASHIAIVTGDGDFLPLVRHARDAGIIVQLYHGRGNHPQTDCARELWEACDERFPIDDKFVKDCAR